MKTKPKNRKVRFMHKDGCLVRIVTAHAGGGRTYPYRCTKDIFETVAWAMAETPREGPGATPMQIARRENLPFTQVTVALEFLKERGIVEVRQRRCYPATSSAYLDAMVEWHALAEEPKPIG
ncbi:MAG: hypothetical protein WBM14_18095 [Terracidiphilus sp.]